MPGRVMLISGVSKGLGRYLTEYYLDKGFQVVGCSRSASDLEHPSYMHVEAAVNDEKAVKKLFSQIRKTYSRLDILINNAGIASMNHFLLTPVSTIRKVFDTNYLGSYLLSREAAKLMKKNKSGRIVNFSTIATKIHLEGEAAYVSSKAAIEELTRISARELAADGITVNAVAPSLIKTDLIKNVPSEKLDAIIGRQPIKRYTNFEDIINVVDFFLRPQSDFISGQVIYLGGIS